MLSTESTLKVTKKGWKYRSKHRNTKEMLIFLKKEWQGRN